MLQTSRRFAYALVILLAALFFKTNVHATDPVAAALKQAKEATEMTEMPESRDISRENHTDAPSPDAVSAGPEQRIYPNVKNGHLESGGNGSPTSSIYYPIFDNPRVDEELRAFALDMQTAYENEIRDSVEDEKPDSFGMWEQTGFFTLDRPSPEIVSITFNIYNYTGGAHGQIYICVLNYNLKTGKRLELSDLFAKPEQAIAIMSAFSRSQLLKTLGEDADEEMIDDGTEPKDGNFANLALLPQGVAVEFQPYQVGPWSIGQQHVEIPLAELAAAGPNPVIWPQSSN